MITSSFPTSWEHGKELQHMIAYHKNEYTPFYSNVTSQGTWEHNSIYVVTGKKFGRSLPLIQTCFFMLSERISSTPFDP